MTDTRLALSRSIEIAASGAVSSVGHASEDMRLATSFPDLLGLWIEVCGVDPADRHTFAIGLLIVGFQAILQCDAAEGVGQSGFS